MNAKNWFSENLRTIIVSISLVLLLFAVLIIGSYVGSSMNFL